MTTKRYILTGTPGCGKTTLIRYLESMGHDVVEEAATDVISLHQSLGDMTPWNAPFFIERVVQLQIQREQKSHANTGAYQFFDRAPFCTLALAKYLGLSPPPVLINEVARIQAEKIYQQQVFFIENLGYITPTDARKIDFEEALQFETLHREVYIKYGFELIMVPKNTIKARIDQMISTVCQNILF